MFLGRVIGTVVATRKDPSLAGHKLMVVQKLDHQRRDDGHPIIAIDHVRAGVGDLVFLAKGREAGLPVGLDVPVDAGIMGVVDIIQLEGAEEYSG